MIGHIINNVTRGMNMGFFEDNADKLTPLALDGKAIYRECQVAGIKGDVTLLW